MISFRRRLGRTGIKERTAEYHLLERSHRAKQTILRALQRRWLESVDRKGLRRDLVTDTASRLSKKFVREDIATDPVASPTGKADRLEVSSLRSKIAHLSVTDLFRGLLTPQEIEEFDKTIVMQTCKAGYVFYTPGETGEVLFILKRGSAQMYRMSPEGRKLVIAQLPQYAFFGEMSCIGQGMYDTFAEATEDSLICTMGRADVERLILSRPRVGLRILEAIGKRVVEAERQLEELAFRKLIPRVAGLLLREAEGDEVRGLAHQDIAERLGVYRETATNALNELRVAGLIEIRRKRIKVIDRRRLERAASE